MKEIRVDIASPVVLAMHGHPSEKGTEDIVELLELVILLVVVLPVLRTGPFLLRTKSIVMCPLFGVD